MNHTQEQLLKLLSSGVSNAVAAQALGITDSAVSQYLAETEFANLVAAARVDNLQAATKRDRKYDAMEDTLLEKLESTLPFMVKPHEILGAIRIVNNAQRRGASSGADVNNQPQKVVVLNMPMQVVQKFTLNNNSEVVEVADKTMATLPSATLLKQMRASSPSPAPVINNIIEPLALTIEHKIDTVDTVNDKIDNDNKE